MDAAVSGLRVVAVFDVERGHAVQPRLTQLRGRAVRVGQSVVEVNQLLVVYLVNLLMTNKIDDFKSIIITISNKIRSCNNNMLYSVKNILSQNMLCNLNIRYTISKCVTLSHNFAVLYIPSFELWS